MVEYIVAIDVTRVQFPADASGSYTSYMLVLVIVSVRVMFLGFSTPFLSEPMQTYAASEDRTHDLRIMGPTRCQLRYRRLNVVWYSI